MTLSFLFCFKVYPLFILFSKNLNIQIKLFILSYHSRIFLHNHFFKIYVHDTFLIFPLQFSTIRKKLVTLDFCIFPEIK